MNADPSRTGAGGEENSWETLAEDLFGIDLGADPARDSLVVPEDLSLDEPESSSSEAKAAKDAPDNPAPNPRAGKHEGAGSSAEKKRVEEERRPAGRGARPAHPSPRDEDDFGADLGLDEPAAMESPKGDDLEEDLEDEVEIEEEDHRRRSVRRRRGSSRTDR